MVANSSSITSTALVPPFRFSTVEHHIYRGAYPTLRNFRFLRRLRLKTIVSIIPEQPTQDILEFCANENIKHFHFVAAKFSSDVTIQPSMLSEILSVILTSDKAPLYIHCLDGGNVTGVVIMVMRKLQHWNTSKITSEFCRFSRDQTIEKEENEYLNAFSEEIFVPTPIASWLWHDVPILKHPTLKLRFAKDYYDSFERPNRYVLIDRSLHIGSYRGTTLLFVSDLSDDASLKALWEEQKVATVSLAKSENKWHRILGTC